MLKFIIDTKKNLSIAITIVILIQNFTSVAYSKNYYFSQSIGNDNWSGTIAFPNANNTDGPKQSLNAFNQLINSVSQPGDSFLLRRNDLWNGNIGLILSSVQGTSLSAIVIGSYDKGMIPVISKNSSGEVILCRGSNNKSASYLIIQDLQLTTFTTFSNAPNGVIINEAFYPVFPHHITLRRLNITNCKNGMILYQRNIIVDSCMLFNNGNQNNGQGIFASVTNLQIKNCKLDSNGCGSGFVHSVYISKSDTVLIEGNEITRADDGLKLRNSKNLLIRKNFIHQTYIHTLHAGGDSEGGLQNMIIESNRITNAPQGIELKSESGIQTSPTENVVIRNNIVNAPITLSNTSPLSKISIFNNLVFNMGENVSLLNIIRSEIQDLQIKNNIFFQVLNTYNQALLYFTTPSALLKTELNANLYHNEATSKNQIQIGTTIFRSIEQFRNANPNLEKNGLEGNPNFTDLIDFKLNPQSRNCIDKGENLETLVTEDITGLKRPLDGDQDGTSSWDIGPYEYDILNNAEPSKEKDLLCNIFPNPASEITKIHCKEFEILKTSIYNLSGDCLVEQFGSESISVHSLTNGLYLFKIQTINDEFNYYKIVVHH
ncbi:MAG: right-handed parallel beta-helix repeat-containing protein [Saprospiraceae bacterium]|nr:right-handed parallel beta-helix repeat-containing protein [Saprospiraceae bacterium]